VFQEATASSPGPEATAGLGGNLLQQLELLGWIDCTALAVLLVFFVLGLFKGLFWQVSRIVILLVGYFVAGRFGGDVGRWLAQVTGNGGPDAPAETTVYLAYLLVFLAVLVVLAVVTMQLQKLVKRSGLTFFDRLGGGLFGVATGAFAVLFLLFVVNMFFRDTVLWRDAEASHSQRLSRRAIDWLGPRVPDDVRTALLLAPMAADPAVPPDAPPREAGPGAPSAPAGK
jgi:membrane protein required for colicin V production